MAASDDSDRSARDLFARNLRRLRRERGLTQEALSGTSGLMQSYLSEVEAGKRNISLDAMAAIAGAMEIPLARLFEEAEVPVPAATVVADGSSQHPPARRPAGSRRSRADGDPV